MMLDPSHLIDAPPKLSIRSPTTMTNATSKATQQQRASIAESLQRSEQRFSDIAEVASDWFWETDENLRFTYFSERVFEATGVRPEFHYGKTRRELALTDDDPEGWRRHLQDLDDRKPFKNFIFKRKGPDGTVQWMRTSGIPYYDANGNFCGYRGAASNITEEVETREAVRRSEQRFRDIAESSFDRFWETDAAHRFTFISDSGSIDLDVSPDSLIGKSRWDAAGVDPNQDEHWRAHVARHEAREPFRDFRFSRLDQSGGERHYSINGLPVFDDENAFTGYRGTATDITARIEADRAAAMADARLAVAVESLSEIFVLWDADDRLVICNEQFRTINQAVIETTEPGTRFEDHIRATLEKGLIPSAVGREEDYLKDRLRAHKNPGDPIELERQDGRWILLSEQTTNDGGVVTVSMDITNRKEVERLKSEFISTVSHELRTPLTSIKGSLGLIASGALDAMPKKAESMITIAHKNSDRLVGVVNDILAVDQLRSGYMAFDFQILELSELVRESVEANVGFAKEHGVTFSLNNIAPGVRVRGDDARLTQVIANLLSNAAKFSPAGGVVTISMTLDDGEARVSISDSGPGIPEDFRGRIFGRFAQADASDIRQKKAPVWD